MISWVRNTVSMVFVKRRTLCLSFMAVYHGCPSCFDSRNDHPFHNQRKMTTAYNDTIRREQRLRDLGYKLKTIWEHDYRRLKNTNEMRQFLDMFDIVTDLEPLDAFFGGRVNGFKLFRDAQEGETISYVDFTSLYPFVNNNRKYPIKEPTVIRQDFKDISNYFGLVKCKVLAPANLYHPVLPIRVKDKLFFPYASNVSWKTLPSAGTQKRSDRFGVLLPQLKRRKRSKKDIGSFKFTKSGTLKTRLLIYSASMLITSLR